MSTSAAIARMIGSAHRVLRPGDSGEGPFDAIVIDGDLDRIDELRPSLTPDGFFVIRLRGFADDSAIVRLLEARGLLVLSRERWEDEVAIQAFPAASGLRAALHELRREVDGQSRELAYLHDHVAQQHEGISWLRHELALKKNGGRRARFAHAASVARRSARAAYLQGYTRFVSIVGRRLPQPVKSVIKRVWNPWPVQEAREIPRTAPQLEASETSTYDILCFSIIDWSFRWQRPQQLVSKLADAGHRVFYLHPSEFLPPADRPFEVFRLRENVWEIRLAPPVEVDVYSGRVPGATAAWFPRMLDELRREMGIDCAVSLVQVASWSRVALDARERFGWRVVYDCMDEWKSFPGISSALLASEEDLVKQADLVTVSGARLFNKWRDRGGRVQLVRNAVDFNFYTSAPREKLLADLPRPVAGYIGAIASWFDVDLLRRVATRCPQVTFVLIGGVFDVDVSALRSLPNVHLLGQQPYDRMPSYLEAFDVCLIPFVVDETTAATDPVKFYEYVSLGKPVVATSMPELAPYRELLYIASTPSEFLVKLDAALQENDPALRKRRVELARQNTWTARAQTFLSAARDVHPRVSILIVTYGNWEMTRLCLDAVVHATLHPNYEVIVVDNASSDDTVVRLTELAAARDDLQIILNADNRGFAAANNQAIRAASGDVLVLLNNDTVPARGWLPRMLRHLEDPQIGLVNAVTNFSGNESRIHVPYTTLEGMPAFAAEYAQAHAGEKFDILVAAMYCVGMRRDAWERIGPLDEAFGVGMFEDDDYSHRARLAGLRVVCAEDVFVHHFGQASFRKLPPDEYNAIFRRNQEHYERKWGVTWRPHTYR